MHNNNNIIITVMISIMPWLQIYVPERLQLMSLWHAKYVMPTRALLFQCNAVLLLHNIICHLYIRYVLLVIIVDVTQQFVNCNSALLLWQNNVMQTRALLFQCNAVLCLHIICHFYIRYVLLIIIVDITQQFVNCNSALVLWQNNVMPTKALLFQRIAVFIVHILCSIWALYV